MDVAGEADAAVVAAGQAARAGAGSLRDMSGRRPGRGAARIAAHLVQRADAVLAANADDVRAAKADGLADAFVDRLTLDAGRIDGHGRSAAHAGGRAGGAGQVLRPRPARRS